LILALGHSFSASGSIRDNSISTQGIRRRDLNPPVGHNSTNIIPSVTEHLTQNGGWSDNSVPRRDLHLGGMADYGASLARFPERFALGGASGRARLEDEGVHSDYEVLSGHIWFLLFEEYVSILTIERSRA